MKLRLFVLEITILFLAGCSKQAEEPIPKCIREKVSAFSGFSCEHGANVDEYFFQDETVFVFEMGFCGADLSAEVVDENCNTLGWLGGGSGNTKINGEEFSNATFVRTIWSRE